MFFRRLMERAAVAFAISTGLLVSSVSAQEAYPLGPGDTISVTFLSHPSLDRNLMVGVDGAVFVPLIGEINVMGQTINELREQIPNLLTGSVYRDRVNGEALLFSVEAQDVLVDVASYRPVFIDGDVNQPGAQAFMAGMTARQGVAAARGVATLTNNRLSAAELRNHPQVLMADLVGILAEMAVHRAILSDSQDIDLSQLEALGTSGELLDEAVALARSQVLTAGDILTEELGFLDTAVAEAETRVIAALRREETMATIVASEEAEAERIAALAARGAIRRDAVSASRRLLLQALDRLGGVQSERLAAEADWRQLVLERNQALRERALSTQARLQELSQSATQLRVRIGLSSSVPFSVEAGQPAIGSPIITVYRLINGQVDAFEIAPDALLMPGDVVHVSLSN